MYRLGAARLGTTELSVLALSLTMAHVVTAECSSSSGVDGSSAGEGSVGCTAVLREKAPPPPTWDASSIIVWLIATVTAAVAAYISAADDEAGGEGGGEGGEDGKEGGGGGGRPMGSDGVASAHIDAAAAFGFLGMASVGLVSLYLIITYL